MARQRRSRGRTTKRFGRLPVADRGGKGNAEEFMRHELPTFLERVAARRRELDQAPGSCEYVPLGPTVSST